MDKQCKVCGKVKPLTDYSPDQKDKDGNIKSYKTLCKECLNANRKRQRQGTEAPTEQLEGQLDLLEIIPSESLTPTQIKALLDLLKEVPAILSHIKESHNKAITLIPAKTDKTNRRKQTFNIDGHLLDNLKAYADKSGISQSDIVNQLLEEDLKRRR